MSDREQRQLALMHQRIDGFRAGRLSIGRVSANLEGLVSALEETTREWKQSFIEQWGVLETAYAVALDRQERLPDAGDSDIAAALDGLDALIAERAESGGSPG